MASVSFLMVYVIGYKRARVDTFLESVSDPLLASYQVKQSILAIGSGGLFGRGLGRGSAKLFYLPAPHTDFIFATLAEEGGFIVALLVLILIAISSLARHQHRDSFARPARILSRSRHHDVDVLPSATNLMVATAMIPATGLPLPFLSYGGSSMVFTSIGDRHPAEYQPLFGGDSTAVQVEGRMRRIMFAGGGTGGHLFPAFAIAEEFKRRLPDECDIRFFVTGRDFEMKLIGSRGYGMTKINVRGLKRGTLIGNVMFFPILAVGIIQAIAKIITFNPDLVVGTGGYLSFPAVLGAKLTNRTAFIQEQNSFAGVATLKLARFADLIFIAYHESLRNIEFREKCILSGNPVNPRIGEGRPGRGNRQFQTRSKQEDAADSGRQSGRGVNQCQDSPVVAGTEGISNLQIFWQCRQPSRNRQLPRLRQSGCRDAIHSGHACRLCRR